MNGGGDPHQTGLGGGGFDSTATATATATSNARSNGKSKALQVIVSSHDNGGDDDLGADDNDTVGSLLADIAHAVNDALAMLMFADKRHWTSDEFEQVRALDDALDEAKRDFQELGPLLKGSLYYENDRRRMFSRPPLPQNFPDWPLVFPGSVPVCWVATMQLADATPAGWNHISCATHPHYRLHSIHANTTHRPRQPNPSMNSASSAPNLPSTRRPSRAGCGRAGPSTRCGHATPSTCVRSCSGRSGAPQHGSLRANRPISRGRTGVWARLKYTDASGG